MKIDFPWLPVVDGISSDDEFREHVVQLLRSGEMTPNDQRWLAECFEPKGKTRHKLEFSIRKGHYEDKFKRTRENLENVSAFKCIRDTVREEFREAIQREGDKARRQADTEAVKRATVTMKVTYGGKRKYISEKAAYTLLNRVKALEEADREAREAMLS